MTSADRWNAHRLSKRQHALGLGLLLATLIVGLLFPSILLGKVPAFRDTMHFYYPLWKYLATLDFNERLLPQWNRFDAFGSSLVGEPTTMTFYPLRWLLIIDYLSLERRIGVFLAVHLAIASAGMYLLSRRLTCRAWPSVIAAISYSLSGPIFFQIYNPPYLVGAAWLPFVFAELWRSFRRPSWSAAVGVAISSSLLIVGGDLQSAYHVAIIAAACGLAIGSLAICRFRSTSKSAVTKSPGNRAAHWSLGLKCWSLALVLAGLFSSIQLLPTWHWFHQSNRVDVTATSKTTRYEFSVPPYQWTTFVHPGVLGSYVPFHTRWVGAFDPYDRVWTPSLSIGVIGATAFVLGLSQFRKLTVKMAVIMFLIALLSACGDYGLGGVWNSIVLRFAKNPQDYFVANELGGLQWLWNQTLPLYDRFQYPAKWLTLASMGACVLAAQGLTYLSRERKYRLFHWVASALLVTWFLLGCVVMFTVPALVKHGSLEDEFCGAFSATAFQSSMVVSLIQAVLLFVGVQFWHSRSRKRLAPLLILAVVDLSMNAMSMQLFADHEIFQVAPFLKRASPVGHSEKSFVVQTDQYDFSTNLPLTSSRIRQRGNTIAIDQIARRVGKLHLLVPEINPLAQYSLEPAAITRFKQEYFQSPSADWKDCKDAELDWEESNVCRVKRNEWTSDKITIPILWTEGWEVTACEPDGMRRKIELGSADGLRLTLSNIMGIQEVRLQFTPPGLRLGMVLFFLGLAVVLFRPLIRLATVCYSLRFNRMVRE